MYILSNWKKDIKEARACVKYISRNLNMQDKIYITNVTDSLEKKGWYVIVKTLSGKADLYYMPGQVDFIMIKELIV